MAVVTVSMATVFVTLDMREMPAKLCARTSVLQMASASVALASVILDFLDPTAIPPVFVLKQLLENAVIKANVIDQHQLVFASPDLLDPAAPFKINVVQAVDPMGAVLTVDAIVISDTTVKIANTSPHVPKIAIITVFAMLRSASVFLDSLELLANLFPSILRVQQTAPAKGFAKMGSVSAAMA